METRMDKIHTIVEFIFMDIMAPIYDPRKTREYLPAGPTEAFFIFCANRAMKDGLKEFIRAFDADDWDSVDNAVKSTQGRIVNSAKMHGIDLGKFSTKDDISLT